MFRHDRCKISVFTQGQEVLLVQCVHIAGAVIVDDFVGDDQRAALVRCSKSVHAETREVSVGLATLENETLDLPSRQTSNRTEQ